MKNIFIVSACLMLSACAQTAALPLGNDMMEIDVSAAPIYGRTGAMNMAYEQAAKATINAGYDKFIVGGDNSWNENTTSGGSYGSFGVNPSGGSGSFGSGFSTYRHPESKLIIKMFHNSDKGADKAIDARTVLTQKQSQ